MMKVLIVTSEWPISENDITGIHVVNQVNRLREAGLNVSVFNFLGHKNPLNYVKAILKFRKLDFGKYDVIHAHHGQSGVVALTQRKLPVVVTFHGSDLQGIRDSLGNITFLGKILNWTGRTVARFADEVILVSEHLKAFIPAREYHIIPAGIDTNLFRPLPVLESRMQLNLPQNQRLVLFIGDPQRTEKRFWLAREIVEIIKPHLDVELIVASGVPHHLMPIYMSACDVLLVTSSSEGSPTVVKEALASRLPIVSVDVGDVRNQIGQIQGCAISKDDRPAAIALSLSSVLTHPCRLSANINLIDMDEINLIQKVILVYEKALRV